MELCNDCGHNLAFATKKEQDEGVCKDCRKIREKSRHAQAVEQMEGGETV